MKKSLSNFDVQMQPLINILTYNMFWFHFILDQFFMIFKSKFKYKKLRETSG